MVLLYENSKRENKMNNKIKKIEKIKLYPPQSIYERFEILVRKINEIIEELNKRK